LTQKLIGVARTKRRPKRSQAALRAGPTLFLRSIEMSSSIRDETIIARDRLPRSLTHEIVPNLKHGVLNAVILPALRASDRRRLAVPIGDNFHFHMAFCAEHLARLRHPENTVLQAGLALIPSLGVSKEGSRIRIHPRHGHRSLLRTRKSICRW
jgi:hypothetical protein